ncbi:MAG TPA: hemerythrin domain-containing protein [Planctomycetaceae bacterium]|nr:hemerythrin domain-containing protein [Planctomycetaceae bacterium]
MTTALLQPPHDALAHHAALEHLLLGDLRELLEEPPDRQNRRWLLVILDGLLETLPRQFLLEEQGGYLAEVLDQYPSWRPQVDGLRRQHGELYATLDRLRDRVAGGRPFGHAAADVRRELRDWMHRLIAHNRHENRILQTAMNLEVGTGD